MLEFALVFLMFVFTVFVIVRTGALSPASIVCAFSLISIAVFCYVVFGGGRDTLTVSALSFAIGDYHQEAPEVIGIYFLLVALIAASTLGLSKGPGDTAEGSGNYLLALMDRFLFSSAMPLIAAGFFGITLLAFLLSSAGAYNSPIVQVVGMGQGPACILYISLLIYAWGKQSKLVIAMLLLLFLYNYAYILAYYSRFAALTWIIATGLIASKRIAAGKSAFSLSVLGCGSLSIWMFLYAIQGRGSRVRDSINVFNLPAMAGHFFGINFDSTTFASVATNIFAGPMILAECLGSGSTVTYNPPYMYLSFSPLPAFLDGWRSIVDSQHFVNKYTPFNAFAEVYYFGGLYIILFAVLLVICIRVLTKIYLQLGGAGGLLLTAPCVYSLLCLHQYALRNSMRLLYLTTMIVYLLSRYLNKKAKESGYAIKSSNAGFGRAVPTTRAAVRTFSKVSR